MSASQVSALLAGLAALLVGLRAIFSQKISIDWDHHDEPNHWVYGWRAVAVGCLCVLGACLAFAAAAGKFVFLEN
ncbi:hypothetical protein [Extensimonas sp. H3M7-6]|uniref:hypothetical protein n=1 Tax=Extensimonas soli TaxID=3031322 RepID=UPI0023D9A9BC|nr:hypothetical protein [Extensimonas sp. H3M7-6]MDF1480668.1 hypothetical protein [Extensimonas sp. H3M7-6]